MNAILKVVGRAFLGVIAVGFLDANHSAKSEETRTDQVKSELALEKEKQQCVISEIALYRIAHSLSDDRLIPPRELVLINRICYR